MASSSSSSSSSWFPSGKRFDPKDDELLVHLFNFIAGDPFSSQDSILIPIVDLYGDEEPWDIFARNSCPSQKKDLYFYTRLKKRNRNGDLSELFKRFKDIRNGKDLSFEPCVEEVINGEPPEEIGPLFLPQDEQLQDMLDHADSFLNCLDFEFNVDEADDSFWKSYTQQQVLAK